MPKVKGISLTLSLHPPTSQRRRRLMGDGAPLAPREDTCWTRRPKVQQVEDAGLGLAPGGGTVGGHGGRWTGLPT